MINPKVSKEIKKRNFLILDTRKTNENDEIRLIKNVDHRATIKLNRNILSVSIQIESVRSKNQRKKINNKKDERIEIVGTVNQTVCVNLVITPEIVIISMGKYFIPTTTVTQMRSRDETTYCVVPNTYEFPAHPN